MDSFVTKKWINLNGVLFTGAPLPRGKLAKGYNIKNWMPNCQLYTVIATTTATRKKMVASATKPFQQAARTVPERLLQT